MTTFERPMRIPSQMCPLRRCAQRCCAHSTCGREDPLRSRPSAVSVKREIARIEISLFADRFWATHRFRSANRQIEMTPRGDRTFAGHHPAGKLEKMDDHRRFARFGGHEQMIR